ncbi:DUF3558 family protein [Kutzneria chonburiensis]|uniref:DUF3558 family protein n=1 Tax=Kutzneria chonburiensis TaxID=1483604 RepID=A0ABV6MZW6_9PSEU|nr:DUF3558 family protein [Kutzneria chonburiensis]
MRRALVFGLAALALAGCSATSDANPAPVKLDDLDLKPYVAKPCSLLTDDQRSDLGLTRPPVDHSTGPGIGTCFLTAGETDRTVTLEVATDWPDPSKIPDKIKIAGYPAVEIKGPTTCKVQVSVGGKQQISGFATGPKACHSAENVATSAIGTIKQHSP